MVPTTAPVDAEPVSTSPTQPDGVLAPRIPHVDPSMPPERVPGPPVSTSVAAARRLLPLLYDGQDISTEAHRLVAAARAAADPEGECAALYSALAAASVAQDHEGSPALGATMVRVATEHGLTTWESVARQYIARLQLGAGHEDTALSGVVAAELLIDEVPPSVELAVALNGIALTYLRLGLFEDSERISTRLVEVVSVVDDVWARVTLTYNRLLNQAAWGLSLERTGSREVAQERLRTAAAQARMSPDMARSHARHNFEALCLFADLMNGTTGIDAALARRTAVAARANVEPLSFVHFALAHRLADDGRFEEARAEIAEGLATVHSLELEPAYSMLVWLRASIAVRDDPDHQGLRDAWDYAQLATAQVWELRVRRREAAQDRLRIGRMRREHERVEQAALEDPLTRTANRRRLDRERASLLDTAAGRWITVVYLDIDDFKTINDTHGHELGDAVLRSLARVLNASTRDGDLVGRYGGDEFVVVAHDCSPADADLLSDRLLAAVRAHPWAELHPAVGVRVSLGLASSNADHHRLFPVADAALYDAKRAGRDRAERRVLDELPPAS
jgi:diguanylate cyclase (GGDEF)-like protein